MGKHVFELVVNYRMGGSTNGFGVSKGEIVSNPLFHYTWVILLNYLSFGHAYSHEMLFPSRSLWSTVPYECSRHASNAVKMTQNAFLSISTRAKEFTRLIRVTAGIILLHLSTTWAGQANTEMVANLLRHMELFTQTNLTPNTRNPSVISTTTGRLRMAATCWSDTIILSTSIRFAWHVSTLWNDWTHVCSQTSQ